MTKPIMFSTCLHRIKMRKEAIDGRGLKLRGDAAMCQVQGEDLVRALKKFKSLAKQDLLTSELTNNPCFWRTHAEARRKEYTRLIHLIENSGVEKACVYAFKTYEAYGLNVAVQSAEMAGSRQALELFFGITGLSREQLSARLGESKKASEVTLDLIYPQTDQLVQEQT